MKQLKGCRDRDRDKDRRINYIILYYETQNM